MKVVGVLTVLVGVCSCISLHDLVSFTRKLDSWWTKPHFPLDLTKPEYISTEAEATGTPNLMELAQDLKLNQCVEKFTMVGLNRLLNHEGWYTVFCPTDKAFREQNFMPGDDTLIKKMRLHVARGLYNSTDFHNEAIFRSLLSKRLVRINKYETGKEKQIMTANGQPIVSLNHRARNGYLHIVDGVMNSVYNRGGSVISELEGCCPQHSELIELIKYAGLYKKIDTENPITLLAPTNGAFARLHPEFVIHLKKNRNLLSKVLNAHVISGTWYSVGLTTGTKLKTWSNEYITISRDADNRINFSNARSGVITDINAANGVTHTVESLVVPASVKRELNMFLAKLHADHPSN